VSSTRVYHLEDSGRRVLVRAVSSAQATSFVARSRFPCRVATQGDMEAVLSGGGRVHDATDPEAVLPAVTAPSVAPSEPVSVVAPVASVALVGVSSVDDVLRHLAPAPVAAALGVAPAAGAGEVADATHFTKTQGEPA
jgi:hypothetical protein